MKVFSVEFAPLFIPIKRRVQTFSVALWFFIMLIGPLFGVFILIFSLFTSIMPLSILYIFWLFYDRKTPKMGGRPVKWIKKTKYWEYFRDYFPISLVKTSDLDVSKNYIFGYHPHGILGCSTFCNFCTDVTNFSTLFPGIKISVLTLVTNFYFPIFREYILFMGLCDVSKESLRYLLTKNGEGNAAVIVIGGAEEALEARPGSYKLTIKNRKGFIKMALETGSSLVPCFGFHENDLFNQLPNPKGSIIRSIQEKIKKLCTISPPMYYGRGIFNYTFGMMPYRKPLVTVVGKPIDVVKDENPSKEKIDELHETYLNSLVNLFEENKHKYGIPPENNLIFV